MSTGRKVCVGVMSSEYSARVGEGAGGGREVGGGAGGGSVDDARGLERTTDAREANPGVDPTGETDIGAAEAYGWTGGEAVPCAECSGRPDARGERLV